MKYGRTILTAIGMVALLVSFTSRAGADIIDFPGLGLKINEHAGGHGPPDWVRPSGQQIAATKFEYNHKHHGKVNIDVHVEADPDPFLSAWLTCVNTTGTEQPFAVKFELEISPALLNGSTTTGSVSFTLLDQNGNHTAQLSTTGNEPIYQSIIDGVDYAPLWDAPKTWTTGDTVGQGSASFGPLAGGPNVTDKIEIELSATLSAFDMAYIVATFEVTPEPGTIALLTIGGMTMMLRRRRRRA